MGGRYLRLLRHTGSLPTNWCFPITYATVLETYSLEEILELNDLTAEDALEYLVEQGIVDLPDIRPLDFDASSTK